MASTQISVLQESPELVSPQDNFPNVQQMFNVGLATHI
jgi:hypothetical protein